MTIVFPIDFGALRKAIIDELQLATQTTAIMSEPEVQAAPRPPRPYFSVKFMNPSIKVGDDGYYWTPDSTLVTHGGQRETVVSFQCFGCSHEQAYNYMFLWQAWLEQETAQARLRVAGIAVWKSDAIRDISELLETAYEGRAQMDVHFGIASNITEDLSSIETINITGKAKNAEGTVIYDQNQEFDSPT